MATSSVTSGHAKLPEGIKEENVVLITEPSGLQNGYTIHSLVPETEPNPHPTILQTQVTDLPRDLLTKSILSHLPPYLRLPPEDIHVLISVKSGAEKAELCYKNVLRPILAAVGLKSYQVLKTESHETVRKFASGRLDERAGVGRPQTVILLSGDGGVVDIINGLARSSADSRYFDTFNVAHMNIFFVPTRGENSCHRKLFPQLFLCLD
jgi:hypothetical protein